MTEIVNVDDKHTADDSGINGVKADVVIIDEITDTDTDKELESVKEKRKTQLVLPVKISNEEYREKTEELIECRREIDELEKEKKEVVNSYKSKITAREQTIDDLCKLLHNGSRPEDVPCMVYLDHPAKGKATVQRLDTNEIVTVRDMNRAEIEEARQPELFPQEEDESKEGEQTDPKPVRTSENGTPTNWNGSASEEEPTEENPEEDDVKF